MRIPSTPTLLLTAALAASTIGAAPSAACAPVSVVSASSAPATAAVDQVDDLIAEGRKLLALREATRAEGLFLQAAELDGQSFRTRLWVLRAQMDQGGRSNDTLDAIEDLAKTHDGPDIDYLFGMAFARRAEEQVQQGAVQAVNMNFETAIELLSKAVEADPDRYEDAWLPLSFAAWFQSDLDVARPAAEQAVQRFPKSAEAAFQLGQVALAQYGATQADPEAKAESDGHWTTARDAFRRAVQLSGTPRKTEERALSLLGRANLQLGHTLMWRDLKDEAKEPYTQALAWYPSSVDCAQLFNMLGTETLGEVLEAADKKFTARYGEDDPRDSAMLWWLGYTRYAAKQSAEAEAAFEEAVSKAPSFVNAWFYIAMARYDQKKMDEATQAFLTGWEQDPPAILREMASNPSMNTAKVEYLIGPCVEANRFADAAVLAEICAETAQTEARHWNNLGFFRREEGIRLAQSRDEAQRAAATRMFELSLAAYERSLGLAPDDPTYLNDTAVILHYYLDRELDRALELYAEAAKQAEAKLEAGGLSKEGTDLVRTALRDAGNNRRELEKLLAAREREAARKAKEEAERKAKEEAERKKREEQEQGGGEGGGDR